MISDMQEPMPLRPSGLYRVIGCVGSRQLEGRVPAADRRGSSRYAEEGSAAHDLVYRCLTTGTIPVEWRGDTIERAESWPVTDNMVQATSVMVGFCRDLLARGPRWVTVEQKMPVPGLDMPNGGMCDFGCVTTEPGGDTLWVVDYKHGAGVYVDEVGNPQFMSYGRGALSVVPEPERITEIKLVCVQPRAKGNPVRVWGTDPKGMEDWYRNVALPAVEASRAPDAPVTPGAWCQFCDAKSFCMARLVAAARTMGTVESDT